MFKPRLTELHAAVAKGSLKGLIKGGASAAALSLATGAAVVVTAPAWVPVIGGTLMVSGSTVAAWSATGAAMGTVSGGAWSYLRERRFQHRFEQTFNPAKGEPCTPIPC